MPGSQTQILVVDDEPQIRRLLKTSLGAQKIAVIEANTGGLALKRLATERVDLVILDLGLPDQSGLAVLEQIRNASAVPIIVLSVRSDEAGKVRAFDLGADDYVTKPFGMAELLSRIRAALRHRYQAQGTQPLLKCGDITINLVDRWVRVGGRDVKLSKTEFEILHLLAEHQGKVLTHDYLLRRIWGPDKADDVQYLRVYIRAIRQKLNEDASQGGLIRTETGIGYRLIVPETDQTRTELTDPA